MKILYLAAILIVSAANVQSALATDPCKAVALTDIKPTDNPYSGLKKGEIIESVTQYLIAKKDQAASFCQHGGSCYPRFIKKDGKNVEAVQLTNCTVGTKPYDTDEDSSYYAVIVDKSRMSGDDLKRFELSNKLMAFGIIQISADGAVDQLINDPTSECGKIVDKAIKGDRKAISIFKVYPNQCN